MTPFNPRCWALVCLFVAVVLASFAHASDGSAAQVTWQTLYKLVTAITGTLFVVLAWWVREWMVQMRRLIDDAHTEMRDLRDMMRTEHYDRDTVRNLIRTETKIAIADELVSIRQQLNTGDRILARIDSRLERLDRFDRVERDDAA
jgi:hypothetical protein